MTPATAYDYASALRALADAPETADVRRQVAFGILWAVGSCRVGGLVVRRLREMNGRQLMRLVRRAEAAGCRVQADVPRFLNATLATPEAR